MSRSGKKPTKPWMQVMLAGYDVRLADSAVSVCEIVAVTGFRPGAPHFAGGACEISRRSHDDPTALLAAVDPVRQVAGGQERPRPCLLRNGGTPRRLDESSARPPD